jgi:hypothetical protein
MIIKYAHGDKIGELVYIASAENVGKKRQAVFLCHCGVEFVTRVDRAKGLRVKSCGCSSHKLISDKIKAYHESEYRPKTHGLTNHRLYSVWHNMKDRCHNPNSSSYDRYGSRGVIVCDEWRESFEAFYSWAMQSGYQSDLQIDKDLVGNGLLYSPTTCCWLTPQQNSRYKKSSQFCILDGKKMSDKDASIELGYNHSYVYKIRRGLITNKYPNLVLLDRDKLLK